MQAIVDELGGEKIDIIRWSEDIAQFISESLGPARVNQVVVEDEEKRIATVIVASDQQSLAIGRSGQNVRLAARLTGWRIDIRNEEEWRAEQEAASAAEAPSPTD